MKITLHEIDRTHSSVRFRVENDERPEEWAYKASNGIELMCVGYPRWYIGMRRMYLQAECTSGDNDICKAAPFEYKEIQAAVAESNAANAANATHDPDPDRVAVLTERVAQMESRLAALESADDPVQDDAGSGEVHKKPRFTRDGNRVIDNERNLQTWFAAEDIADDALADFTSGKSCICSVSWEPIEPDQPPVPEQPKRRRVWCNEYDGFMGGVFKSRRLAELSTAVGCLGQVEFIEVLLGDGDVDLLDGIIERLQDELIAKDVEIGGVYGDVSRERHELKRKIAALTAERDVLREQMERFAAAGCDRPEWADAAHYAEQAIQNADKAKEASDERT